VRLLTLILSLLCINVLALEITPEQFNQWKSKADEGDAEAQFLVSRCYYNGTGVTADPNEAIWWCRKSAVQGYAVAQGGLGLCYQLGRGGLNKESKEAVFWLRKAAEQGEAMALGNLGICYANGVGVEKDQVEAYAYYDLAGSTFKSAFEQRDKLAKEMTPEQIKAGQKRSIELQAEIEARITLKK
jgi:hypothetical protein